MTTTSMTTSSMTTTRAWHPLLEGDLAEEAWRVIHEVAAALQVSDAGESTGETGPNEAIKTADLASGSAGLALFYSYLAEVRSSDHYADIAVTRLKHAVEALANLPMPPGLYSGFTGVAWTVDHLDGRLLESDDQDQANREIDEAVIRILRRQTWQEEYDLISGLVGFGVYALEGLPRPTARQCLELLVSQLEGLAQDRPEGVTWFSPPEWLPEHQRSMAPKGYYNLGVAHGVPGVIAVLGVARAAGLVSERSSSLLERAVAWLLAQELDAGAGSCFSIWSGEGIEPESSRLAWCYGDLGLAVTLLLAARCAGRADWRREALRIALRAAARPPEQSGVLDAGLCHGAAGLGHLFNRLYQATGEKKLAVAARCWFERTLEMRRPGEGIAGFLAWAPESDGTLTWQSERGFLLGGAGIALALLGAISSTEPEWDRVLLASGGG